jgi:hypothetical protein
MAAAAAVLPASAVSFDVAVVASKSGFAAQTTQFHVDRTRGAGGAWRTTLTMPDQPGLSKLPRSPWRPKQFVVDEAGTLTIYRADGAIAPFPDPTRAPNVPVTGIAANLPSLRTGNTPTAASKVLRTDWIDEFVTSASGRAQEVAAIIAKNSAPARDGRGLDHYVKTVGSNAVDVAIDPLAGVVSNLSVTSQGQVARTITNQYVNGPSGVSIRWHTQIQHQDAKSTGAIGITLSNILIDGQGVKP